MGSETVQEIQIVTNNYSAEYRSAAGGILSAVTKSGTNTLSGSLFEFNRNDALDAANYFDKKFNRQKPDLNRNQFGFSLGGPIMRNRLFFFGSYEGLREEQGKTDTAIVPSMNARQGRLANGRTIAVNPAMVRYLGLYPIPGQDNSIVQDFGDTVLIAGSLNQVTDNDFALGKIDYQAAGGHTLSGTYNFDRGERSPFGIMHELTSQPAASNIASAGTKSVKHVLGTKWTAVLNAASLSELNFGYSDTEPQGDLPLSSIDWADEGLLFRPDRQRMGQIDVPNVLTSVGFRVDPSMWRQRGYALKEGYSLISGNHSYRMGGEWTYYRYNVFSCTRGCNGIYEFRDVENLVLGNARRFEVMLPGGDDPVRDLRQHLFGVYLQDNWQARSNITINLGLRYEYASVPTEVDGKTANLRDFTDPEVTVGPLFENPTAKSFSPRVGVVWAPHEGRTSSGAASESFTSIQCCTTSARRCRSCLRSRSSAGSMAPASTSPTRFRRSWPEPARGPTSGRCSTTSIRPRTIVGAPESSGNLEPTGWYRPTTRARAGTICGSSRWPTSTAGKGGPHSRKVRSSSRPTARLSIRISVRCASSSRTPTSGTRAARSPCNAV